MVLCFPKIIVMNFLFYVSCDFVGQMTEDLNSRWSAAILAVKAKTAIIECILLIFDAGITPFQYLAKQCLLRFY